MVPKGWTSIPLGGVSLLVTSGSRDWAKYYSAYGNKFIRMTNLNRDGIDLLLDLNLFQKNCFLTKNPTNFR